MVYLTLTDEQIAQIREQSNIPDEPTVTAPAPARPKFTVGQLVIHRYFKSNNSKMPWLYFVTHNYDIGNNFHGYEFCPVNPTGKQEERTYTFPEDQMQAANSTARITISKAPGASNLQLNTRGRIVERITDQQLYYVINTYADLYEHYALELLPLLDTTPTSRETLILPQADVIPISNKTPLAVTTLHHHPPRRT